MKGFINNIINRHLHTENVISPRLPGRYEQYNASKQSSAEGNLTDFEMSGIDVSDNTGEKNEKHFENQFLHENNLERHPNLHSNSEISSAGLFKKPSYGDGKVMSEESTPDLTKDQNLENEEYEFSKSVFENSPGNEIEESEKKNDQVAATRELPFLIHPKKSFPGEKVFINYSNKNDAFKGYEPGHKYDLAKRNYQQLPELNTDHDTIPVIKVSIGRIEVRAIVSNQTEKKPANTVQNPITSLDNYLKQRNGDK